MTDRMTNREIDKTDKIVGFSALEPILERYYQNADLSLPTRSGKLAFLDTNEHFGEVVEDEQSVVRDWIDRQKNTSFLEVDGGIVGIGAGNIFSMLRIVRALHGKDHVPECLVGIDIDPHVVILGKLVTYLALCVGDGVYTREEVVKLLFGTEYWDEESQKLLQIVPGDSQRYTKERTFSLIQEMLAKISSTQGQILGRMLDKDRLFELLDFIRGWKFIAMTKKSRPDENSRSITRLQEHTPNENGLSIPVVLYTYMGDLVALAQAGRMDFILGSITDEQVLGLVVEAFPMLTHKGNLLYESNALNHVAFAYREAHRWDREGVDLSKINLNEVDRVLNSSGKGVHIFTNREAISLSETIRIAPYELTASNSPPAMME